MVDRIIFRQRGKKIIVILCCYRFTCTIYFLSVGKNFLWNHIIIVGDLLQWFFTVVIKSGEERRIYKIFRSEGFVEVDEFKSYILRARFRPRLYINPASRNYWLHSGIRGFDKCWRGHTRAGCVRVRDGLIPRELTHTPSPPSIVHTDVETKLAVIRGWLAAVDPCGGIYIYVRWNGEEVKGKSRKKNCREVVVE